MNYSASSQKRRAMFWPPRWHQANSWFASFRVCVSFFAFSKNASASVRSPDDLCASYGVVWIYGSWNHLYQPLVPDGAARRWSELRLNLTALVQQSPLSWRSPPRALALERSCGTRQLRNWCKDAIRFHTYTANIGFGISNRDPIHWLVATWLILPVVICLS